MYQFLVKFVSYVFDKEVACEDITCLVKADMFRFPRYPSGLADE